MAQAVKIGQGGYGCVYAPTLFCDGEDTKDDTLVTKLLKTSAATKEMKEYKLIERIDPNNIFYPGKPRQCKPASIAYNVNAAKTCGVIRDKKKFPQDYTLLQMTNAGENLDTFSERIDVWLVNDANIRNLMKFWISLHRAFKGLVAFDESNIVHHDLKPQNIMFHSGDVRANIIDFGMTFTKADIIKDAIDSRFEYDMSWWNFPPENNLFSKKWYDYLFKNSSDDDFDRRLKVIVNDAELNKALKNSLLLNAEIPKGDFLERKVRSMKDQLLSCIKEWRASGKTYQEFLTIAINKIDVYGFGLALLRVASRAEHLMPNPFLIDMNELIKRMLHPSWLERITIQEATIIYEDILLKHLTGEEKEAFALVVQRNDPVVVPPSVHGSVHNSVHNSVRNSVHSVHPSIHNSVHNSVHPSVHNSVHNSVHPSVHNSVHGSKNDDGCPEGKERNPLTRRCVNKCKANQTRNAKFQCVTVKQVKEPKVKEPKVKEVKDCQEDQERNPHTRRCVKKCKANQIRNDKFQCVTVKQVKEPKVKEVKVKEVKDCQEDQERNPHTRRCVKKCKANQTRNDKFQCVTVKVPK